MSEHYATLAQKLQRMSPEEQAATLRTMDDEHWARYGKLADAHGELLKRRDADEKHIAHMHELIDMLCELPGGKQLLVRARVRMDANKAFRGEP
jgi:hypothetical protein